MRVISEYAQTLENHNVRWRCVVTYPSMDKPRDPLVAVEMWVRYSGFGKSYDWVIDADSEFLRFTFHHPVCQPEAVAFVSDNGCFLQIRVSYQPNVTWNLRSMLRITNDINEHIVPGTFYLDTNDECIFWKAEIITDTNGRIAINQVDLYLSECASAIERLAMMLMLHDGDLSEMDKRLLCEPVQGRA